jgi:hypothetical protein
MMLLDDKAMARMAVPVGVEWMKRDVSVVSFLESAWKWSASDTQLDDQPASIQESLTSSGETSSASSHPSTLQRRPLRVSAALLTASRVI